MRRLVTDDMKSILFVCVNILPSDVKISRDSMRNAKKSRKIPYSAMVREVEK